MIGLICLLVVLKVASCLEQLPTRLEIETSINRTIDEVERLVRDDPSLPRLTRNEIVDILFNITSTDMKSFEKSVEQTREEYQRALMVVLPLKPNDSEGESLEKLYGKPPPVEIIQNSPENPDKPSRTSDNLINTTKSLESDEAPHKNHRDTYTEISSGPPTEESLKALLDDKMKADTAPVKFSFDLKNFAPTTMASFRDAFFKNALNDRVSSTGKSKLEIVYSTSVTQRPTTKFIQTTTSGDGGFRPTMPPTKPTETVLASNQWRYNAPLSSTTLRPRGVSGAMKTRESTNVAAPFLPTVMTKTQDKDTERSKPEASTRTGTIEAQEGGSSWKMEDHRTLGENAEHPALYVTPMTSARLETANAPLAEVNPAKTPMPMREEVQDLLESIGLRPESAKIKDSSKGKVEDDHEKIFGTNFQIPESSNVIPGQASGLTAVGIDSPSIISQNTFQKTPQDVKKGFDNLSPDVQLMFQRFGLQSSAKEEKIPLQSTTLKPRVITSKTSFWNNFKPLPTSRVSDNGMRDFLAKFGLGIDEPRKEKSMKTRKHAEDRKPSLIEAVPGNMKAILENIGLITRTQRPTDNPSITTTVEPHVFKPHETSIDNEKQRAQINELLDTVKLVQEGKADVQAVQEAAKKLLEATRTLKNGPDPLSLEEILKMYNDDVKNEIKRQQDPKDLKDMAISETAETTTVESSTEATAANTSTSLPDTSGRSPDIFLASTEAPGDSKESGSLVETFTTENSNLDALADSFGGSTAAPDPVLPTPRKTGLYFLVDWNTFLEVGEEEKDKVNLRFQPKAGDRTRFISVTIP